MSQSNSAEDILYLTILRTVKEEFPKESDDEHHDTAHHRLAIMEKETVLAAMREYSGFRLKKLKWTDVNSQTSVAYATDDLRYEISLGGDWVVFRNNIMIYNASTLELAKETAEKDYMKRMGKALEKITG